jgi:hypothetical protein
LLTAAECCAREAASFRNSLAFCASSFLELELELEVLEVVVALLVCIDVVDVSTCVDWQVVEGLVTCDQQARGTIGSSKGLVAAEGRTVKRLQTLKCCTGLKHRWRVQHPDPTHKALAQPTL